MQETVSVIIPVYRDRKRLAVCLAALERQTYPRELFEIIVIDNGLNGNLADLLNGDNCRLIVNEKNTGDASRNKGVLAAKGEILAFTDSDCIPAPDWIEQGVRRLAGQPGCGLAAGKVEWHFQKPGNPAGIEIYDAVTYLNQKKHIEVRRYGATANLFAYKKVFDSVGLFREDLRYACGSDLEWGRRAAFHGYGQAYAGDAVVTHPPRSSMTALCRRKIMQARVAFFLVRREEAWLRSFFDCYRTVTAAARVKTFVQDISEAMADSRLKKARHKLQFVIIHLILQCVGAAAFMLLSWGNRFGKLKKRALRTA